VVAVAVARSVAAAGVAAQSAAAGAVAVAEDRWADAGDRGDADRPARIIGRGIEPPMIGW
jgi:hypothetical protein